MSSPQLGVRDCIAARRTYRAKGRKLFGHEHSVNCRVAFALASETLDCLTYEQSASQSMIIEHNTESHAHVAQSCCRKLWTKQWCRHVIFLAWCYRLSPI